MKDELILNKKYWTNEEDIYSCTITLILNDTIIKVVGTYIFEYYEKYNIEIGKERSFENAFNKLLEFPSFKIVDFIIDRLKNNLKVKDHED